MGAYAILSSKEYFQNFEKFQTKKFGMDILTVYVNMPSFEKD
jgi:hypothetical protein